MRPHPFHCGQWRVPPTYGRKTEVCMFGLLKFLPFLFLGFMLEGDGEDAIGGARKDVLSDLDNEDSETSKDSPSEKTEDEAKPGDGEKTHEPSDEEKESNEEKELLKKGDSIPFQRFKSFIEKRNSRITELEGQMTDDGTELEELREFQKNPNVYKAILQSQGITDEKILNQKMAEKGFQVQEKIPDTELVKKFAAGLDLTKPENWFIAMKNMMEHVSKSAVQPIQDSMSTQKIEANLRSQAPEAKKVSEEYGVEYGDEDSKSDANNPKKGIGILLAYLYENPVKMKLVQAGHLSKGDALVLAMKSKGFELGKQKGKQEELTRNKNLKDSQMEDGTQTTEVNEPTGDASFRELMDYAEKHPDKI